MKKIKRRLSQNEITIMSLNGVLTGVTQYLKEKGMLEDCQAWFKVQLKGGDGNGVQGKQDGKGEEGYDDGQEVNGIKGNETCCDGSGCCQEGKEEVGKEL